MPFHFDYEETFPNTDFNQINLDWILQLATQLKETAESGGFDGAPGEPGTATNGIAFISTSNTFADIQAAIAAGELPVLMYYNMGTPIFMYCYDYSNTGVKFGGLSNTQQLQLLWLSDDTKSFTTRTLVTNQSPQFYGNPTVPTQEPNNSSTRIASTAFVQNAVSVAIQNAIEQLVIAPFSESFKQALLQLAQKVAYIDGQGQTYYNALYDALYPPINVDSITAVWNPPAGYVVYSTDTLDSLKSYLTVTATYDDQTTEVIPGSQYTLTGTLTAGTSTITATYINKSDTFNVTVVANALDYITAVFTQGDAVIYDNAALSDLVPMLAVTATYTNLNTVYVDYPNYMLSGTLTAGTSTITVTYGAKTDTFTVAVTAHTQSQGEIVGTYTNGRALGKKMNSNQGSSSMPLYSIWRNSASARAATPEPFVNNNYTFTVTDSSKYNLAVYGVTDPAWSATTYSAAVDDRYCQGDSATPTFAASGSTNAPYVWVSLKKMDNTGFTAEELSDGAAAVFTISQGG